MPVFSYPPATVKRSVTGRGRATKEQVASMVAALAGLGRPPRADAADALAVAIDHTPVNWVLDADIAAFFDTVDHERLIGCVERRVGDRRVIRLLRKWLKAGVMEDGRLMPTEEGTPQGAVISPLLANIYLHYVLDLWAQDWRQRHARGNVVIVRYADDAVLGRMLNQLSRRPSSLRSVHPPKLAVRPDAVVNRASTTRGDAPRRTTAASVTGPPRPSSSPSRRALNVGGSGQTWYGLILSKGSGMLLR